MVTIGMSVWSRQVISCKKSFLYFIKNKPIDFYLRDRPCFHFGFNAVLSMKAHRPTKLFHSLNLGRRGGLGNVYCNRNTNFISSICLQQKTEKNTFLKLKTPSRFFFFSDYHWYLRRAVNLKKRMLVLPFKFWCVQTNTKW